MARFLDDEETLVLAPQVMVEFVHIVTDPRRFADPLPLERAIDRAEMWWHAKEVLQAFPTDESVQGKTPTAQENTAALTDPSGTSRRRNHGG